MLGIFLDSETNGLNPKKHHIIELAYKIIDVESGEIKECYEAVLAHSLEEWKKSDPSSIHITGFTWEEIKKG
ncbi:MAG: 3'-5' exonuclease, partial [Simkania negevensis]|nr:3'-5' exonuclease [Simkania negevensis]